jgi:hypothetical protein
MSVGVNRFTRLSHTGLVVELEHLKIKTRLTNLFLSICSCQSVYKDLDQPELRVLL